LEKGRVELTERIIRAFRRALAAVEILKALKNVAIS
jgi:hypothetical protein